MCQEPFQDVLPRFQRPLATVDITLDRLGVWQSIATEKATSRHPLVMPRRTGCSLILALVSFGRLRPLSIDDELIAWMDGFVWIETVPEDDGQHGDTESIGNGGEVVPFLHHVDSLLLTR